jgi:fimbrial chaperone protein
MMLRPGKILAVLLGMGTCHAAFAADVRVAPSTVEPSAGGKTATLSVRNEEQRPLRVQIRAMKWMQENGSDVTMPTQDVVASPPFITLQPMQQYQVRIVRTGTAPLQAEESYRVLIDEIPDAHEVKPGTVNLVLRQSLPVFFSGTPSRTSNVTWTIPRSGSTLSLVARNTGTRRMRIADLTLEGGGGAQVYHADGLIGYVLPGAERRWTIAPTAALPADGHVHLTATSDTGPIDVSLVASSAQ